MPIDFEPEEVPWVDGEEKLLECPACKLKITVTAYSRIYHDYSVSFDGCD